MRGRASRRVPVATKWERFQILIAGPVMNILLAVVVMAVVLAQGTEVEAFRDEPPVVGAVLPGSAAEQASASSLGDRILTVAGRPVDTWEDLFLEVGQRPDRDVPMTLERDGRGSSSRSGPSRKADSKWGTSACCPTAIPSSSRSSPAIRRSARACRPATWSSPSTASGWPPGAAHRGHLDERRPRARADRARDGREVGSGATPEQQGERGMMARFSHHRADPDVPPRSVEAVVLSVQRNIEWSGLIFRAVGGLITGETSVRQLQGPVGIAQLSGESAQQGSCRCSR
jgi:regulator of sigma E protease